MTSLTRFVSLVLLMLLYVNSFVDRQIIAVLGESIRQDLGLSFTNLGWLYGPSFSWVYAIMGLVMVLRETFFTWTTVWMVFSADSVKSTFSGENPTRLP